MKKDKVILYLDEYNKKFLVYDTNGTEHSLYSRSKNHGPVEYIDNGVNKYINNIKEKWQIDDVKWSKNKLTLEFKLLIRKDDQTI